MVGVMGSLLGPVQGVFTIARPHLSGYQADDSFRVIPELRLLEIPALSPDIDTQKA